MRCLRRILRIIVVVVSFLLFVGVCVLSVRSRWMSEGLGVSTVRSRPEGEAYTDLYLMSHLGGVTLRVSRYRWPKWPPYDERVDSLEARRRSRWGAWGYDANRRRGRVLLGSNYQEWMGFGSGDVEVGPNPARLYARFWNVPHWFAAVVTGVAPAASAAVWVRRRRLTGRRARECLCPACGYDLRATPGPCPECGTMPTR